MIRRGAPAVLRGALAACLMLAAAACERGQAPAVSFERMWDQQRVDPYDASPLFTNGMAMRPPPDGTVPRDSARLQTAVASGADAEQSLPRTRAALERGRERFDIYCAACHGHGADGVSPVARFMSLRPPPTLLAGRARELSAPQLFTVISHGYGLMPSYAHALSVEDRWAVVAYLRVLQLRDRVPLDSLPDAVRRRALQALGPPPPPGNS